MTTRRRASAIMLGAASAAVALVVRRHIRGALGRQVPGGTLVPDAARYDALGHRFLLRSLLRRIADDVAAAVPEGASVLEVGCGPGRLSILLAREHGLEVTGLDFDPTMIERARDNLDSSQDTRDRNPTFLVGDVASMEFADRSFDLVVSMLSMHHWADPAAGLAEIGRVLRPDGRALIWDFRRGFVPPQERPPDPAERARGTPLRVVSATPWAWPWRFALIRRLELTRADGESGPART